MHHHNCWSWTIQGWLYNMLLYGLHEHVTAWLLTSLKRIVNNPFKEARWYSQTELHKRTTSCISPLQAAGSDWCGGPGFSTCDCRTDWAWTVSLGQDNIYLHPAALFMDCKCTHMLRLDRHLSIQYWALHQCCMHTILHQPLEISGTVSNSTWNNTWKKWYCEAVGIFTSHGANHRFDALFPFLRGMAFHVRPTEMD